MSSKKFRIVFMGTPDFAVPSLQALLSEDYTIPAVVTAPDRPSGRGLQLKPSPVKTFALQHDIPVLQPERLRDPDFQTALRQCAPDLIVVVAFRMLPESIWAMPPMGTINLHASLLPQYRGAAPINWAIINGESESGLTTFFLDKEIDAGRIIRTMRVPIPPETSAGELHDVMMLAGAGLLIHTVEDIRHGKTVPLSQEHLLTDGLVLKPAPKLTRELGRIDWASDVKDIHNLVRGLSPRPGAYSWLSDGQGDVRMMKILEGYPVLDIIEGNPGNIHLDRKELAIACKRGWYSLRSVQMEGKPRMKITDLLNGLDINKNWFMTSYNNS